MEDSKIAEVLRTFDRKEFKEFEKFVHSPFFTKGRDLYPFLKVLKLYYPGFNSSHFNVKNIFKKLRPRAKYDQKHAVILIRTLSSELLKMAEEYLTFVQFSKHPEKKCTALINELTGRKLNKLTADLIKQADKKYFKDLRFDTDSFINRVVYLRGKINYYDEIRNVKEIYSTYSELMELFTSMLITEVINGCIQNLNFRFEYRNDAFIEVVEKLFSLIKIEEFLDYLESTGSEYYKLLKRDYHCYMCYLHPEEELHYRQCKKYFFEILDNLDKIEKRGGFFLLENICVMQIKRGNYSFYQEKFQIYKKSIELGLYKPDDSAFISIEYFRNLLLTAIYAGEISWLELHLNKFLADIEPAHRKDITIYAYALINLHNKKFKEALELINKLNFDQFYFKTDLRAFKAIIYYELNYTEELFLLIDAYKHFLKNNSSIHEQVRTTHNLFIKNLLILLTLKLDPDKSKILGFRKSLEKSVHFYNKKWILEKLSELEK